VAEHAVSHRLPGLFRHHTRSLITGRLGYVRATSVNPAAENMATLPVKMADAPTRAALRGHIDRMTLDGRSPVLTRELDGRPE
jgi:hypothetical protein